MLTPAIRLKIKNALLEAARAIARTVGVIIHDPAVRRTSKQLGALIAVRLVIAAGGSVELANLIAKAFS